MRFLLDANIPRSATSLVLSKGHDALHISNTALKDADDDRIAHYACSEQRAVVTRDLDFADVRRYPPANSPGYLVMRVPDTWIASEINDLLAAFLDMHALIEHIPCHLVVLDPRRVRFRPALVVADELHSGL